MSTLDITRSYVDGSALTATMLDDICDDIETIINVTGLNDDNIQNAGITASSKLIDASISTAKIAASAITTSLINASAVTTAKIADSNVTTAKIADSNVTTAKINDAAVTQAKRAALGQQVSSSSGAFTGTSTTAADVTNLSVTITTTGRAVWVGLVSDGNGTNPSRIGIASTDSANAEAQFLLIQGSTEIARVELFSQVQVSSTTADPNLFVPPGALWHLDVPAAATYTYKVQYLVTSGTTARLDRCKLVAFEL